MPLVEREQPKLRAETTRATTLRRPRRERDAYGPKRTAIEIEEAIAYKRYERNPTRQNTEDWIDVYDRLKAQQGLPTPVRCGWCRCVRSERPYKAPCDYCGHINETGES